MRRRREGRGILAKRILRRVANDKSQPLEVRQGANKILDSDSAFEYFGLSLPAASALAEPDDGDDPFPVPVDPEHPWLVWFASVLKWAIENPEKIAALIKMILALFGM